MNETLSYVGKLVVSTCWCGMRHAVPSELEDYQRRMHDEGRQHGIYCPLGHSYVLGGKSRVSVLESQLAAERARHDQTKAKLSTVEHSRAAIAGEVTKIKKRVGNGVCPCCNRTFKQLAAHMKAMHPEYKADLA